MYEQFFGLNEKPFVLTPNPRYVFYSERYREAEEQLLYAIGHGEGFMLVTGRPGTGKTTLCRDLLEKMDRSRYRSALIFNPFMSGVEMLATLLSEFGVAAPPSATRKELLDNLNNFLLAQLASGFRCIAIFDEAQHLTTEFLEQIRVLSNLETDSEKLIQIVLVGQPELLERVRTPAMAQLDQRVSVRCTLSDLDEGETDRYIHHRLYVAGARGQVRFDQRAVREIRVASQGVPRVINLVADRALLAGFVAQTHEIGLPEVQKAVNALRGEERSMDTAERDALGDLRVPRRAKRLRWAAAAVALAAVAAFAVTRGRAAETPEALFWRATMARTPADAERLYQQLVAEHAGSPRTEEALLRLAELEMARGDDTAALDKLGRLRRDYPKGALALRAAIWTARVQLTGRDSVSACATIGGLSAPVDVDLRSQHDALAAMCAARNALTNAAPDSAAMSDSSDSSNSVAGDAAFSLRRTPAATPKSVPPGPNAAPSAVPSSAHASAAQAGYSIQLAAYDDDATAERVVRKLVSRGIDARVEESNKLFRVRVGRYRTADDAESAARELKAKQLDGVVVASEAP
jgi:general secretion pathway protein A